MDENIHGIKIDEINDIDLTSLPAVDKVSDVLNDIATFEVQEDDDQYIRSFINNTNIMMNLAIKLFNKLEIYESNAESPEEVIRQQLSLINVIKNINNNIITIKKLLIESKKEKKAKEGKKIQDTPIKTQDEVVYLPPTELRKL
jgi:hypothetical protein